MTMEKNINQRLNLVDVEKSLLSLILTKKNILDDVNSIISKEDFENGIDAVNKTVFDLCERCNDRYKYVSIPAIIDELKNSGVTRVYGIADMDIKEYIESLSVMYIRDDNYKKLAEILKDASVRRRISVAALDIQKAMVSTPFSSAEETISLADKRYNDCIRSINLGDDQPTNLFDDIDEAVEETKNQDESVRGYAGPHPTIQKIYGSLLRPGNMTVITSRSGIGKSLANFEQLATSDGGFISMGEVKVGQKILSKYAKETVVEGVFPQGMTKCCQFEYEDGREKTVCSYDHLWEVFKKGLKGEMVSYVMTAGEIQRQIKLGIKMYVPSSIAMDRGKVDRPKYYSLLSKYFNKEKLTKKEIISFKKYNPNYKSLNILSYFKGSDSALEKAVVLLTYIKRRKMLMLSKGYEKMTLEKKFYISSEDIEFLKLTSDILKNVGCICILWKKNKGKSKLFIDGRIIRYCSAKIMQAHFDYTNLSYLRISAVKDYGFCETTCIKVSDESHLFLLKNNVLTHNTQFTMDYCIKTSQMYDVPVLHMDNGEMSKRELQYRQISSFGKIKYWDVESGNWKKTKEGIDKMKNAVLASKNRKVFYYQASGKSFEQISNTVKRFYENFCKGGQMYICFDYIKPPINGTNKEDEHKYIGRLMDRLKRLIQDEILVNKKPVISLMTSVQSNRSGTLAKKTSEELEDSENVLGISDRIIHYASHCFILRFKARDEIASHGKAFGTHVLIPLKGRFLGEDPDGYVKLIETNKGLKKNLINLSFKNFGVTEHGDLRDIIKSQEMESRGFSGNTSQKEKDDIPF